MGLGGVAIRLLATFQTCSAVRFLILRHGQTNHNAAGIIQGSSDASRLTEKGRSQAIAAGAMMATLEDLFPVDRVLLSPLMRAKQTLDLLESAVPGKLPPAITLQDLREIDLGRWQGCDKASLRQAEPEAYESWKQRPLQFEVDGARPVVQLWDRAGGAWKVIRECEHEPQSTGGVTLIVSHNACGQALLATAFGADASTFRTHEFPNCGACEIEWPSGAPHATRWRWRLPVESEWRSSCM